MKSNITLDFIVLINKYLILHIANIFFKGLFKKRKGYILYTNDFSKDSVFFTPHALVSYLFIFSLPFTHVLEMKESLLKKGYLNVIVQLRQKTYTCQSCHNFIKLFKRYPPSKRSYSSSLLCYCYPFPIPPPFLQSSKPMINAVCLS